VISARLLDRIRGLALQLRVLFAKQRVEQELDEEIAFHVEMEMAKHVAAGMSPTAARRRALLRFGGADWHKESVRDARWTRGLENLGQDLRYAFRSLRRSPALTAVAIVTIGFGVGATTAMVSVGRALLDTSIPVTDPDRLYTLAERRSGMTSNVFGHAAIPYSRYEAYRDATRTWFAGLASLRYETVALQRDDESRAVTAGLTSGNFFEVLGLRPALGRFYTADHERAVVLSHGLWRARFGSDSTVVGQSIQVDSRSLTIVGVAPNGFTGLFTGLPIAMWTNYRGSASDGQWVVPFGRVSSGIDPLVAEAATSAAGIGIVPDESQTTVQGTRLYRLTGMPPVGRPAMKSFMGLMLGMAGLMLLITASNIAGVLLARGMARRREVAVRMAIGAGRGRLMRQLLTETVVLFLAGGLLGVGLAVTLTKAIAQVRLPLSLEFPDTSPDVRVILFGLVLAGATGLIFGVLPALRASKPDLVPMLKDGADSGASQRTRGRGVFVTVQLALAVVLLVAGGLFLRSLWEAGSVDPGFEPRGVVVATINLHPHGYDRERGQLFYTRLLDGLRSRQGIEAAAISSDMLLGLARSQSDARGSGAGLPEETRTNVVYNRADAGYLATLRGTLVAGRWFTSSDQPGGPPATVINETTAARLWPGRNPLGGILHIIGQDYQVVGVIRDGKYVTMQEEPTAYAFFAFSQRYLPRMTLHVRSRLDDTTVIGHIREEVRALDASVAIENPMPMTQVTGLSLLPQRLGAWLVGIFGAFGLLLSAVGLYGILAHDVARRGREIGIRMALGARPADVRRLVIRRAGALVIVGCLIGLVMASAVTRLLRAFLYQVEPIDPVTFVGVPMLVAAVALLASYSPARRAMLVNPQQALRAE
jgi:predicted permease